MARPFSYPEVPKLAVGESCTVNAPASEVARKVRLYAARNGGEFHVVGLRDVDGGNKHATQVTREAFPQPQQAAS